jgi:septum site-determining protein MinD
MMANHNHTIARGTGGKFVKHGAATPPTQATNAAPRKGRVIGVLSGKGGVGKTVTVVNLCAALTKLGHECLAIDANVGAPDLSLHLGLWYQPVGLQDVLYEKAPVSHAVVTHPSTGIKALPSSLRTGRSAGLNDLRSLVAKLDYKTIVIDSPPGIGADVRSIIGACSELLIITTPDMPSVTNATRLAALATDMGLRPAGLLLNRVANKRYEMTSAEVEKMCELPVLASVPEDDKVPESIAAELPVVFYHPRSSAARAFMRLAAKLLSGKDVFLEQPSPEQKGLLQRFIDWILGR